MATMKKKVEKEGGKKKEMITVEIRKEIIEKHERGMRVADIARFYNESTSTICTVLTLNSAWRKLWSDCVEGFAHEQGPPVVDEIVCLWKTMGLEVNEDYIQELVEEHVPELNTGELMDLQCEQ